MISSYSFASTFNNQEIVTTTGQEFVLQNANYLGSGISAEVFKVSDTIVAKVFFNGMNKELIEKVSVLIRLKSNFINTIVSPIELFRFKQNQNTEEIAGYIMTYIPNAAPCTFLQWKSGLSKTEEDLLDYNIMDVMVKLCDAISILHKNRIFVSDLKPQNVLISDLNPYIIDFDSCTMPNYKGESFTIEYLDPLVRGNNPKSIGENESFSELTDWWALAVISFQMFLGASPWSGIHEQFRKDPFSIRSFNYSAVYLDPNVRPPSRLIRDKQWLDQKPALKQFYEHIFSTDPYARVPIKGVLESSFSFQQIFNNKKRAVDELLSKLAINDSQMTFIQPFLDKLVSDARSNNMIRKEKRIELLNLLFSLQA